MSVSIHPTAEVQTTTIGEGTRVWQFCVILEGAIIGRNCNINFNVFIENDVVIGDNVTIKPGVQVWDGVRLSDNVFVGPNATFNNDRTPRSKRYPSEFLKTIIEEGVSIGANATISAGIRIGRYSMIGAGSVLTKNVEPFTLWYGNPAQKMGFVTRNGITLNTKLMDKEGNQYFIIDSEPIRKY